MMTARMIEKVIAGRLSAKSLAEPLIAPPVALAAVPEARRSRRLAVRQRPLQ
jgi:hypothetical protein